MKVAARLVWLVAAVSACRRFSRQWALSSRQAAALLGDCWASGAQPYEAFVWRRLMAPPARHPLTGCAASRVLPRLGAPEAHRLLADKLAAAQFLAAAGLPTPSILAWIVPGDEVDFGLPPWTPPAHLFIKPRRGAANRGTLAVAVLDGGRFVIDDGRSATGSPADAETVRRRLSAVGDDMLVQERLAAAADLADLATAGRPPVLRLTAAREPGGAPFLHSAVLEIDVPGENHRYFLRGRVRVRVRVPVDPATGILRAGLWFRHPDLRLERLPWNGAPVTGRVIPDFAAAAGHVLRAMALLPGLPLANWDLIVTPDGPMILEGNSGGDWVLTDLCRTVGLSPPSLAPLLRRWIDR